MPRTRVRAVSIAAGLTALCAASGVLATALVADAQYSDRRTTEGVPRQGAGADVATVSPTTGHPEVVLPLLDLPGRAGFAWSHSIRYSGARRWESQYNGGDSAANEWIVQAGSLDAINAIGSVGTVATRNAPRPWRTMPLYYLRVVPVSATFLTGDPSGSSWGYAEYMIRYVLQMPDGTQHELRHFEPGGAERLRCLAAYHSAFATDRWRTGDGSHIELDHSDPRTVVVTMPGGTRLYFPWETEPSLMDGCSHTTITNIRKFRSFESTATRTEDRNGNAVLFDDAFDAGSGTGTVTVTGPTGAKALYHYVEHVAVSLGDSGTGVGTPLEATRRRDVETIEFPGPGGRMLEHRFVWSERAFDEVEVLNPLIVGAGTAPASRYSMNASFWVLDRIELADGGRYAFTYWDTARDAGGTPATLMGRVVSDGRLLEVRLPSGGAVGFEYAPDPCHDPGHADDPFWTFHCSRPARFVTGVRQSGEALGCFKYGDGITDLSRYQCLDPWASMYDGYHGDWEQRLDWQRVARRRVYDGLSSEPASTTTYRASMRWGQTDCKVGPSNTSPVCGLFVEEETTGNRTVVSEFFPANSRKAGQLARVTEREGDTVLRTTTYGYLLGADAWDYEDTTNLMEPEHVNVRSLRTEVREGEHVVVTSVVYDDSAGQTCVARSTGAGPGPACTPNTHTRGNVVETRVAENGHLVRRERIRYEDSPAYAARGLWGLARERVIDDGVTVATRVEYFYDEEEPTDAPGAPLSSPTTPRERGNLTRERTWIDGSRFVEARSQWFRTGDVRARIDARGAQTTFDYDFSECAGDGLRVATTTNAKGHRSESAVDCYTGLTRRETDANGASTWTAYDQFSRPVRMWGPGDSEDSPTRWTEYFTFARTGAVVSQRVVDHAKDGTDDGLVTKTFFDGLGRLVQTRTELDPATTSDGAAEAVVSSRYDALGQPVRTYETCGSAVSDALTAPCSALYTDTSYDALGRVVVLDPPGPAITRTGYEGLAEGLLAVVTDGRGKQSRTLGDAFGNPVRVETFWDDPAAAAKGCADGWCRTLVTYDAAGRRTAIDDDHGHRVVLRYDLAGRLVIMEDPDLGVWTYQYDDVGNVALRQDARGQATRYEHDALGRVTLEDREPVDVPGTEDVLYYYDGETPTDCYSCDDHDASTTDRCTPSIVCENVAAEGGAS